MVPSRSSCINRDFRFACPRWPLYTPEGRPAPETLVRHSIVPLQRPSAQPVVTCGRLEALCSRHFSDTAPHVGHFFANRTALPVPRVSLPAPAAPRSAATCRRTAALVHESELARNDPHPEAPHLPISYDSGPPRSVIRFRMLHASSASALCPPGVRARRPVPMIDLYLKKAFSTRACRW